MSTANRSRPRPAPNQLSASTRALRSFSTTAGNELLLAFERVAGVPVLINTSLNDRGEPIAETPADAARMFVAMGIDALVLGDRLFVKR